MVNVCFSNGMMINIEPGLTISECIRKAGLSIETPCNSMGLCGKCKVRVKGELYPPLKEEERFIKGLQGIRLACMARVKGDVEIELPETQKELKTIDEEMMQTEKNKPGEYSLGVAVDIGTTGVSAHLINIKNGEILNKVSALNPQSEFGGDVLTRISFAMENENGTRLLQQMIIKKINELIGKLAGSTFSVQSINRIMIAANTTMLHFFAGINPSSIAVSPYRAVFLDKLDLKAQDAGININKSGIVTLLPSASSYIGADILSGIIATEFYKKKEASVFIDIGTNGEIAAIADGKLAAASTAAGPALEGMNISCGMRAESGAIDTFDMDGSGKIAFTVIGGGQPKGICGSALLDIAAAFAENGIILKSGRFAHEIQNKKFYLCNDVYITQKDIRQIQLAKGAISAGVSMLLNELDISIKDIKEFVIAGAFGYHVNPKSIKRIKLIPEGFDGRISFAGNSSIEGARLAILDDNIIQSMAHIKDNIKIVELSAKPEFQDYFVKALSF